jgi:enolase
MSTTILDAWTTMHRTTDPAGLGLAGLQLACDEAIALYKELCSQYNTVSIEDALHDDDGWRGSATGWERLTAESPDVQWVGDDVLVTNAHRLREGAKVGAANAVLGRVNQIGTLTEALGGMGESAAGLRSGDLAQLRTVCEINADRGDWYVC